MSVLFCDFETWARVPISLGSYKYLTDSDTSFLMMAWALDDEPVAIWWPRTPLPSRIIEHARNGGKFSGFNSIAFERIAWREIGVKKYDFPLLQDEQWEDTMLRAVAANLPRSLDAVAKAVGASFLKDEDGHKLMLRLTSAAKTPDLNKIKPEELLRLAEYCKQDVETERAVAKLLPPWIQSDPWPYIPQIDTAINDRGILIDVPLVGAMQKAALEETARMDADMNVLTAFTYPADFTYAQIEKFVRDNRSRSADLKGFVPRVTNIEKLKDWLLALGVRLKLKNEKVDVEDAAPEDDADDSDDKLAYRLRKNDIVDLLAEDNLPAPARLALEMRLEAAKASAKKLKKMLEVVAPDGRIRWQLKLLGAAQSGRWSGAGGIQVHNMLRDCVGSPDDTERTWEKMYGKKPDKNDTWALEALSDDIVDQAVQDALSGDPDYIRMMQGPVLPFISRMTRRTLCAAKEMTFIQGDYSAIEARMTSWFCQDYRSLRTYAEGGDIYRTQAASMMGKQPEDVTKEERQRGKVAVLALGFAGGIGALVSMGMQYGMKMTRSQAEPIVKAFKEANPELVQLAKDIMERAFWAARQPNTIFPIPPLNIASFIYDGRCLHMNLPSGRQIHYWSPRIEQEEDKFGRMRDVMTCLQVKGKAVFRRRLWAGIFLENISSGSSVDILARALVRMEYEAKLPVVLHVHDSIIAEVSEDQAKQMLPVFKRAMLDRPAWTNLGAIPLPISASVHISPRVG